MIESKQKQQTLNKILNSNSFRDSEKYCVLLTYLVKSTLEGKTPKEYAIAIDVFNKDKNFNPSEDTIVRYYMHRLRKKINEYYEKEGVQDEIELVIPKGHYLVKFQHSKKPLKAHWRPFARVNKFFVVLFLLLLATNIFFVCNYLYHKKNFRTIVNPIDKNDPIWSDFFSNGLPNVLLIGDHFMYDEYDTELQRTRQQTDFAITSRAEFSGLINQYPNRIFQTANHGSIPHNSIFNLNDIYHVFTSFGQKPNIEFTSEYMYSQFNLVKVANQNIFFMGGFRNLRELNIILSKSPIKYEYTDTFRGIITIDDAASDTLVQFQSVKQDEAIYLDYGMIVKLVGAQNEIYLFAIGFAYPSQIETVRLLSQQSALKDLYAQTMSDNNRFPDNFVIVLQVLASEFTALETKIAYFNELSINN